MAVLNDMDGFYLVMDTINRLPQAGDKGVYLKQILQDKLSAAIGDHTTTGRSEASAAAARAITCSPISPHCGAARRSADPARLESGRR